MIAEERFARLRAMPLALSGSQARGIRGAVRGVLEILANRQLLGLLVRRDLKARYKDSILGFFWTLIRPLTQLVIFYFVVGKFLGAERNISEFAVYMFAGLTAYGFFQEILGSGTVSIVSNSGLIKKVYLPREVFPLASVGGALVTFGAQFVILVFASFVLGTTPQPGNLVLAIPAFVTILLFGTALALLLSAVNVYLRDVGYLVEVAMMVLLWGSPIIYGWPMVRDVFGHGFLLDLYTSNPLTLAVMGFQRAFWGAGDEASFPDDLGLRLWLACLAGIVAVFIGQRVFSRLQGNFAAQL